MRDFKIETDRLIITKFDESMAESVHLNSLDEHIRKFVPDEVFETVEEARETILFLMSCYDDENNGPLVYPIILKSGENIGYVQAVPLGNGEWEIGYHIAENYTRNGYATEAVMAFVPVITKQLGIPHIWGICRGDNIPSRKVLEKCSFKLQDNRIGNYKGEQHEICKYLYCTVEENGGIVMINFKDITRENWRECIYLKLHDDEKALISPNVYSIAEAQFYPKAISKAIYHGEQMVGYTLFGEDENDSNLFYIDRLMISKDFRNKGYADESIRRIIKEAVKSGFNRIGTSTEPHNTKMRNLLEKLDFYTKNELDGGEIIYYYQIK